MTIRIPHNRRSWLFIPGADGTKLDQGPVSGADVLIQELEDFTPPERRPQARGLGPDALHKWRSASCVAAVRINPLEDCGVLDLEAIMPGRPNVIMMAMVESAEQIRALDAEIARNEKLCGIESGATEIVPNIETAKGLIRLGDIAAASRRVTGMLLATEDMVADLGGERTPEGRELEYARSRFLVECVAAGVLAIDCPYTFSERSHLETDVRHARSLGYKAKSIVNVDQVEAINKLLTPSGREVMHARAVIAAFESARVIGLDRAEVDGLMVEVPTYRAAKRLLKRYEELAQ